jgi:hypothetical protein
MVKEIVNFIGVGFPKSGTSWISEILRTHPHIYIPSQKELWYFFSGPVNRFTKMPTNHKKSIDWYLSNFKTSDQKYLNGEFTPTYIYDYYGLKKILYYFPNIKVIISIRNPSDLIYSQYNYMKSSIVDTLPFNIENMFEVGLGRSLLDYGKIGTYLESVYQLFPPNNIFVVTFDDLISNKQVVFGNLCNFLGLDFEKLSLDIEKVNESRKVRSSFVHKLAKNMYNFLRSCDSTLIYSPALFSLYNKLNRPKTVSPSLSTHIKSKLNKYYHDEIEKVETLLDISLSHWKY